MTRANRYFFVFLCCLLAVPICVYALGLLTANEPYTALLAGTLLGAAHVALRPILRLITKPLGCLTMGLLPSMWG